MYIPLLHSHEPSNRERRIASIESAVGFLGAIWLMLEMPRSLAPFLGALAVVLLLNGHGLATLTRSNPNQAVLWPEFRRRMGFGRSDQLLDERDLNVRCRAFVISYRILALVILATVLAFDQLLPRVADSAPQKWIRLHDLMIALLGLLIPLIALLPCWVLPWLETDSLEEDDLQRVPLNNPGSQAELFPTWIRVIGSPGLVWAVIALLMLWLFRKYMLG